MQPAGVSTPHDWQGTSHSETPDAHALMAESHAIFAEVLIRMPANCEVRELLVQVQAELEVLRGASRPGLSRFHHRRTVTLAVDFDRVETVGIVDELVERGLGPGDCLALLEG
jgi:hypothetical protein